MADERRDRAWWQEAVRRWRRSGLSAKEFGAREGLQASNLYWWSSQLGRSTRAKAHGPGALVPIEIAVPSVGGASPSPWIEIALGETTVRVAAGTDVGYVRALVSALRRA